MEDLIVTVMSEELGVDDDDLIRRKAAEWIEKYPALNIAIEIRKAARWELRKKPSRRSKNKILFMNNWLRKAGGFTTNAGAVYKLFSERFKKHHAGIEYEPRQEDMYVLQDLVDRRGLIPSFIFAEAFFMKSPQGRFLFFPQASRSITAFKSCLNDIFTNQKVQTALQNPARIKAYLVTQGFLGEGTNGKGSRKNISNTPEHPVLPSKREANHPGIPEESPDNRFTDERNSAYVGSSQRPAGM